MVTAIPHVRLKTSSYQPPTGAYVEQCPEGRTLPPARLGEQPPQLTPQPLWSAPGGVCKAHLGQNYQQEVRGSPPSLLLPSSRRPEAATVFFLRDQQGKHFEAQTGSTDGPVYGHKGENRFFIPSLLTAESKRRHRKTKISPLPPLFPSELSSPDLPQEACKEPKEQISRDLLFKWSWQGQTRPSK